MAAVRISIGAAVDPSVGRSLVEFETRAMKSFAKVRDAQGKFSREQVAAAAAAGTQTAAGADKATAARIRAEQRVDAQIARLEAKAVADHARSAQKKVNADLRAMDQRIKASAKAAAAEEKDILRVAAAAERAASRERTARDRQTQHDRKTFRRNSVDAGVGGMTSFARYGSNIAGQMLRGAGVEMDAGSLVSRNVDLEKQVSTTTRAAFAAKGEVASGADVKNTIDVVRNAGTQANTGFNEMAAGLDAFVSKTGDLETAKKLLVDMAKLSQATGANFEDMMSTAGEAANQFTDLKPDEKAEKIGEALRVWSKQGASGAIEIKDLGQYGARLAAPASAYGGSRETAMANLGVLTQVAKSKGGASTVAEATNSAAAFTTAMSQQKNLKRFEDAGINVWADKSHTKLNSAPELIKAMLHKTGGDLGKMSALMQNPAANRAVKGFASIYNEAGGGTEGLKAVDAEFKRLSSALSKSDVEKSFATAQQTTAAKVQAFNNRLDVLTAETGTKLLPSLERLAPVVEKVVTGLASLASVAAENPGTAIAAAITLSIGKAMIGEAVKAAILKQVLGAGVPTPGGAPGGAGGKALPVAGAALAGFTVGALMDSADEEADKGAERVTHAAIAEGGNATHALRMAETRDQRERALADAKKKAAAIEARIANAKTPESEWDYSNGYISAAANYVSGGAIGQSLGAQSQAEEDAAKAPELKAELAALKAEMALVTAALKSELRVTVTNQPGPAGPGVDPSGRTPAPGATR